jgi:phage repressor protein C with HTH and peptisase S24 domain
MSKKPTRIQQGDWLKAARKLAGYRSSREAAIENNWPESTYRAHENGTRTIGQDDAERYALRFRALGVDVSGQEILYGPIDEPGKPGNLTGISAPRMLAAWKSSLINMGVSETDADGFAEELWDILNGKIPPPTGLTPERAIELRIVEMAASAVRRQGERPPPEFLGALDLPVYAAAEGGPGEMVVSTDAIDFVPRPWFLKQVKDGYAVLVIGDSMEPAFEAGQMALVNPRLPALRGKDAIFVANEQHGEFRATIKRLVQSTAEDWHVRQFNPPKEFKLSKQEWPKALRVVGKFDGG